jgi:hypothetical protein
VKPQVIKQVTSADPLANSNVIDSDLLKPKEFKLNPVTNNSNEDNKSKLEKQSTINNQKIKKQVTIKDEPTNNTEKE